jgi:hypothetical protein
MSTIQKHGGPIMLDTLKKLRETIEGATKVIDDYKITEADVKLIEEYDGLIDDLQSYGEELMTSLDELQYGLEEAFAESEEDEFGDDSDEESLEI